MPTEPDERAGAGAGAGEQRQGSDENPSVSVSTSQSEHRSQRRRQRAPNEPPNSRFAQQDLAACKPLLTPSAAVPLFLAVGLLFVPLGVYLLQESERAHEVSLRYDNLPQCLGGGNRSLSEWANDFLYNSSQPGVGTSCTVNISVDTLLEDPIHVYYELRNYYQGHRRYAQSRSYLQQITGNRTTDSATAEGISESCEPESVRYLDGNRSQIIKPCGLVAWTFFNDTLKNFQQFKSEAATQLSLDETHIAWPSDRKRGRFSDTPIKNLNPDSAPALRGGSSASGPMNENEHLMNWMRLSTLKDFRKLYGSINATIEKGDVVTVEIENRYNVYPFGGEKWVVLANNAVAGGRNAFLAVAYLVIGSLYLACGVSLFVSHLFVRRKYDLP